MLLQSLFFLGGIVFFQYSSQIPPSYFLWPISLVAGLLFWKGYKAMAWFLSGFLYVAVYVLLNAPAPLIAELESKPIDIVGYISGLPNKNSHRIRFDFILDPPQQGLPDKIRLNWYSVKKSLQAGQYWQFTVKLKRPHGMLNPYGFDYEQWLFTQNIGAVGYVRKSNGLLARDLAFSEFISHWRQKISEQIDKVIKKSPQRALIKALAIGIRDEIDDEAWRLFRRTGTVHLLAISGLHIGLVATLVYFFSHWIWARIGVLRITPQTVAAYSALLIALFYAALAGFSVPTQRALVMLIVVMFSIIYQRHIKLTDSLSFALLIILIINPLSVLSSGFWLSFCAVSLILYTHAKRLGKTSLVLRVTKIHFLSALGLAPLLMLFFQQVSIIAPVANFIAVPVVSLGLIPLILISIPLLFIQPLIAAQLLTWVEKILAYGVAFLNALNELPFASWQHFAISGWQALFAILGLLLFFTPRGFPARSLSLILILPLTFIKPIQLKPTEFKMTLLDVGQGLATVVQTKNHSLVFDTGAKYSDSFDMGKMVLLPFLHGVGLETLDVLIVSHADNDHIGGANSVLENIDVKQIYTSVPEKFASHKPIKCKAGQQWQWDGVLFQMLSPIKYNSFGNNNSCVLKISSQHGSILLTGDIEASAEKNLVKYTKKSLASDILIAPHHGSKTSSTVAFLKQVNPDWVLIPSGYKNRFKFPHAPVLQRYQQLGIKWKSTANEGALTVEFNQQGINISSYRQQNRRYWHFISHAVN